MLKYFLIVFLCSQVWLNSVQPIVQQASPDTSCNSTNSGEPLFLTPYVRSNLTFTPRRLSAVPPFCKSDKDIVSHSGFLTVNATYDVNLFFWFFRQTSQNWNNAPLILWLQGGPGCSSMRGVFEEHGPYMYTKNGIRPRKLAWINDYNVLYIDQPAGSGFSFTNSSEGYVRTVEQAAEHLYEALTQFYKLFPELADRELYLTGEAYGARFVAALARKIHTLKAVGKSKINLKGLFLISADIDGAGLTQGLGDVCFHTGIIDCDMKNEIKAMEEDLKAKIQAKMWKDASQQRSVMYKKIAHNSDVNFFDYTKLDEDNGKYRYDKFLEYCDVRKKLHVGTTNFLDCSLLVYRHFYEDLLKNVKKFVEELLEYYPITFVGAQYDLTVPYNLNFNVLKTLEWNGAYQYSIQKREEFVSKRRIDGFHKTAGNLSNILIRGAGHMVPKDQPRVVLYLLNKFTKEEYGRPN